MSGLKSLFGLGESEERTIEKVLSRLASAKTPIRLEVEEANIHFYSVLSIRRGLVVLAKPGGLQKELKREGFVRFRVPDVEGKELRLPIAVPHFNLLSGSYVFLCDVPKTFAEPSRRTSDRFNTRRFSNLKLTIPALVREYRIIDISLEGCKIFTGGNEDPTMPFSMGETLSPAKITVGQKVEIDLNSVVPRSQTGKTVGIQFQMNGNDDSRKYLSHFIKSLESSEQERLMASTD